MLIICGLLSFLIWIIVTFISRGIDAGLTEAIARLFPPFLQPSMQKIQYGFYYDVNNADMPSSVFIILFSLAFLVYGSAIFSIQKKGSNERCFGIILLFALLFRLVLIPSIPIHENDFYRYIWDGKVFASGINPYKYAPDAVNNISEDLGEQELRELQKIKEIKIRNPTLYERIGHKTVPTIYPPASQIVFFLSAIASKGSVFGMKLILILFDVFTILLLFALLKSLKLNPNMVIVYAWSPLILKEIANSAHQEPVAILFFFLGIYFFLQKRHSLSALSLSAGFLSKFYPILMLPILLIKRKWRTIVLFVAVSFLAYVPFFLWQDAGIKQVFRGLTLFGRFWAANGGIFELLLAVLHKTIDGDAFLLAKMVVGIVFITIVLCVYLKKETDHLGSIYRVFIVLVWMFLLSPVANPWYFCSIIPFLAVYPCKSLLLLSWLLIFSYVSFRTSMPGISYGEYALNPLLLIQYIPFYTAFILESLIEKKRRARETGNGLRQSYSVLLDTFMPQKRAGSNTLKKQCDKRNLG